MKSVKGTNMKKSIFLRSVVGALAGVVIGMGVTILISFFVGDGNYYPVVPELIADCRGELNAVVLQTVCCLIYGAAWGGATMVWEKEEWSLLRQSVTHLLITSIATFPIAYFMRWMKHSPAGILGYFGIFIAIYACIWISQYWAMKKKIKDMNKGIHESQQKNG